MATLFLSYLKINQKHTMENQETGYMFYLKEDDLKDMDWFIARLIKRMFQEEEIRDFVSCWEKYNYCNNIFIMNPITKNKISIVDFRKTKRMP